MAEQTVESPAEQQAAQPRWRPLEKIDRRVAGVLVEKAKTTPEQYPLTLNGLINGCNQKNNRDPQMQLKEADVTESLDRLKQVGAVVEVQGSGRVPKFRHLLYDWLGVDKVELAVMAELLLRGAQTEGELRGRAARMEPIADLTVLRSILQSLHSKGLVLELTPAGRGQIISHTLYEPEELERLKEKFAAGHYQEAADDDAPRARTPSSSASHSQSEIQSLRAEVAQLRKEIELLADRLRQQESALDGLRRLTG
jgi:uncharacterized protein YceH (UPF0502 family)